MSKGGSRAGARPVSASAKRRRQLLANGPSSTRAEASRTVSAPNPNTLQEGAGGGEHGHDASDDDFVDESMPKKSVRHLQERGIAPAYDPDSDSDGASTMASSVQGGRGTLQGGSRIASRQTSRALSETWDDSELKPGDLEALIAPETVSMSSSAASLKSKTAKKLAPLVVTPDRVTEFVKNPAQKGRVVHCRIVRDKQGRYPVYTLYLEEVRPINSHPFF